MSAFSVINHHRTFAVLLLVCFLVSVKCPSPLPLASFFANVISNWSVATDQSSGTESSDLQIAKLSNSDFAMAHKMGMAIITLDSKTVPTIQYFNASGTILSGNTSGTTTVTASSTFSTNIPYLSSSKYYSIIKSSGTTFTGTGSDAWSSSYTTSTVTSGYAYTFTAESKRTFIKKGWIYEYTGGIQSLTITQAGEYKLEVWGAQGGYTNGGKGGYSYGYKTLAKNYTLYTCVGSQGESVYLDDGGTFSRSGAGGYNGGGAGGSGNNCYGGCGGGGATHIATSSGTLYALLNASSTKASVLIVAGGGGGGSYWWYVRLPTVIPEDAAAKNCRGGSGGGTSGGASDSFALKSVSGTLPSSSGGSSSSYYALGKGQSGVAKDAGSYGGEGNGGGGGGYYGGFSNQTTGNISNALGGGGSGYIGGVSSGSTSNGQRSGNGYARITTNFEWAF